MKNVMEWIRRQWLRFILCEPEEWAELKYDTAGRSGDYPNEAKAYARRLKRYQFTFGTWKEDRS